MALEVGICLAAAIVLTFAFLLTPLFAMYLIHRARWRRYIGDPWPYTGFWDWRNKNFWP